jgi:2-methylisocitrate lyase-like PEP mutase family enzyme
MTPDRCPSDQERRHARAIRLPVLNPAQARAVRATFTHVSELLDGILRAVAARDPFDPQQPDLSVAEVRRLVGLVDGIRRRMLAALVELGIRPPQADSSVRWSSRTALLFAEIAVSDLSAEGLRGYGSVEIEAARALSGVADDLRRMIAGGQEELEAVLDDQHDRARRFAALHARQGAFIIPNPWDVGSARLLAALGFEALATTSSGCAHAVGRVDGGLGRDEVLAHCRLMAAATPLPVSADLENGFGHAPADAAETIRLAAEAGVVGGSIEDWSGDPERGIYDLDLAVERVHAAVEAVRALPFPFTLTARAENLIRGRDDLDDTIRRLQAFEAAGADVVYAPGLGTVDQVRAVCGAVGRPVNVLAPLVRGASLREMAAAGAKRLSVGGALERVATTALIRAAIEMRDDGTFSWMSGLVPGAEVERLLTGGA